MAEDERIYKPKDAIETTVNATMVVGGAGLCISAVQNSLARENVGPMGIFMRSGSTIVMFGNALVSSDTR